MEPFDQLRAGGYGWLAETVTDHHLAAGIVDVAHLVATAALAAGDQSRAIWAAEQAIAAVPYDDKPRLDLARTYIAMGRSEESRAYLSNAVMNRADDDQAPWDPMARVAEIEKRWSSQWTAQGSTVGHPPMRRNTGSCARYLPGSDPTTQVATVL